MTIALVQMRRRLQHSIIHKGVKITWAPTSRLGFVFALDPWPQTNIITRGTEQRQVTSFLLCATDPDPQKRFDPSERSMRLTKAAPRLAPVTIERSTGHALYD